MDSTAKLLEKCESKFLPSDINIHSLGMEDPSLKADAFVDFANCDAGVAVADGDETALVGLGLTAVGEEAPEETADGGPPEVGPPEEAAEAPVLAPARRRKPALL